MGSSEITYIAKVGLHYSSHTVGAAVFLLHTFFFLHMEQKVSLWWDCTEEEKKKHWTLAADSRPSSSSLYSIRFYQILIPFAALAHLCGEKWELYWVSVHNTVSTASASDCFTASLALCRLTGQLVSQSFAHDQFASKPQQRNLRMTHFH